MNTCPMCGVGTLHDKEGSIVYDKGGLDLVLHGAILSECEACHEKFEGVRAVELLHAAIIQWLASRARRLRPKEIRFLRKAAFGITAVELGAKMDVRPETVSRWENGHEEMSVSMERFLRTLALSGRPVDEYPLEDMATQEAIAESLTARLDAGAWRLTA